MDLLLVQSGYLLSADSIDIFSFLLQLLFCLLVAWKAKSNLAAKFIAQYECSLWRPSTF